ncbi:ElyC/SanA/YdcF family protein [Photobacterium minamisatsumaniensis]|uniref:ElyC/SanA/YdcF family protein n=1 Tax=Photobacterium minamisatsumaniensis TaxID=2910233 RepID=UPI003D14D94B
MKLKYAAVFVASALAIGCNSDSNTQEDAELIIGLGLQVNYETCNSRLLLEQRVDRAYAVSLEKKNPFFAFAGKGNPDSLESCFENGEGLTEAQAMKDYLMAEYGVAEDRIVLEEESISTDTNAQNLLPILEEVSRTRNINFVSESLVTSAYHNHRQSWRDGTDNSSVYYFNRDFGEGSFVDGENVYSSSELAEEKIWNKSSILTSATGSDHLNSARIIGDVSGNGLQDAVKVDFANGDIFLATSTGEGFNEPQLLSTAFSATNHVQLIDLTGNGLADLVGMADNGDIFVALNDGEQGFNNEVLWGSVGEPAEPSPTADDTHVKPADYNIAFGKVLGGEAADLIVFADNGTFVAANQGDKFGPLELLVDDFGSLDSVDAESGKQFEGNDSDYPRFVADVTGNGAADIIAFGHTEIYVAVNDGKGNFTERQTWLSDDAEGNGANFLAGTAYAELVFGVGWGEDSYWGAQYPRGVADVNGNGRADIWAIGEHGVYVAWSADIDANGEGDHFENLNSVWVYESKWRHNDENDTAYRQFTPYRGWERGVHPRMFGDVNGNGRADLVGFGENEVFVAISENP